MEEEEDEDDGDENYYEKSFNNNYRNNYYDESLVAIIGLNKLTESLYGRLEISLNVRYANHAEIDVLIVELIKLSA